MIVIILIALTVGAIAGWRGCMKYTGNKMIEENLFLRNHVEQLKETNKYWKDQSDYNRNVQNTTIINHNTNLKNTLENILNLLQNQNKETLKEGEKEQVENIIKTIKGGISSS